MYCRDKLNNLGKTNSKILEYNKLLLRILAQKLFLQFLLLVKRVHSTDLKQLGNFLANTYSNLTKIAKICCPGSCTNSICDFNSLKEISVRVMLFKLRAAASSSINNCTYVSEGIVSAPRFVVAIYCTPESLNSLYWLLTIIILLRY